MSPLNPAFDPAREAALVTGAGNGIGRPLRRLWLGRG
jgi:3-oxoacyl-[acyl-carrier protein] reductase